MGFNKKILPPLDVAIAQFEKNSDYLKSFINADAWIGPPETARFLHKEILKQQQHEDTTLPEGEHAHRGDGVLSSLLQ